LIATLLAYGLWPLAANASTPIEKGFKTISSAGAGNGEVTGEKPESKLWFNDGSWWAVLWDAQALSHHIFRFDLATQDWVDTGTAVDARTSSRSDVLWNQTTNKLYVVSHRFVTTALPDPDSADRGKLYRFSYNATAKVYTLDAGFPVDVTGGRSETLTIARDTTGKLWVTYVEALTTTTPARVMVNRTTTGTNDLVWGTPFVLPVTNANNLEIDDISSIISYNGRVGIMWSNQTQTDFLFATHVDGAADTTWVGGPAYTASADDHISLKYVPGAGGGSLFAAVKTSQNSKLIVLLVCTNGNCSATADWTNYSVYDSNTFIPTRPICVVDTDNSELYLFTSNQVGGTGTPNAIYYKKTSLTNIEFTPADPGVAFIQSTADTRINNPTSTKQNVTAATGLLVAGSDEIVDFYFHNYLQIASSLAPEVTSFNPASGAPGTQVTLTGNRFTGSTAVLFNTTSAVFTVNSNTQITTVVPVGATTGKISVTNLAGTRSSAANFTVIAAAPLIITSLQVQNAGTLATTATISCLGQPNKQQVLNPGTTTAVVTGWTAPCSPISISNADVPAGPPVITNVAAGSITTTGATITWTTNVPTNSRVDYGPGPAINYVSNTPTVATLVLNHSMALTGLTPGTLYNYRVRSRDGLGNQTISGNFTFTTTANPPTGFTPIRINSGGAAFTDSLSRVWSADTAFSGGTAANVGNTRAIGNTVDDQLYRNERWGTFAYNFTVPAGSYQITLKFSETHFTTGAASGQRVFNVAINGTAVLTNFDIKATAGGANIAVDRTFTVNVPAAGANNLRINFSNTATQPDEPKVDAIQVVASGT
jgi:hypothetical protein